MRLSGMRHRAITTGIFKMPCKPITVRVLALHQKWAISDLVALLFLVVFVLLCHVIHDGKQEAGDDEGGVYADQPSHLLGVEV